MSHLALLFLICNIFFLDYQIADESLTSKIFVVLLDLNHINTI